MSRLRYMRSVFGTRLKLPSPAVAILLACVIIVQFLLVARQHCSHEIVVDSAPSFRSIKEMLNIAYDTKDTRNWAQKCECNDGKPQEDPLLYPVPKRERVYLSIGIPTIQRDGGFYLIKTISSLVENIPSSYSNDVLIVVFLADRDPAKRETLANTIKSNFSSLINSGMIHVIKAPESYYPAMNITKFTYGQPESYIKWRSKQNFDYAFLLDYSVNLSDFYMQLEDDVITTSGYLSTVKRYISEQTSPWTCLEFSELGFIGKLYKNKDLPKLASMMRLFYEEQPVDATYLYFNMMNTQMERRLRTPTLFQHQGIKSSFSGKIQPLKDRFFDNLTKKFSADNPPAEVFSSLKSYLTYTPKLAYANVEGYFWSDGNPTEGDSITVVFQEPQSLQRVVIMTGSVGHPEDRLLEAKLDVSLTLQKTDKTMECLNDITLGEFVNGTIDVRNIENSLKFKVMCIKVSVTKAQEQWVIVKEIAVFTLKTDSPQNV